MPQPRRSGRREGRRDGSFTEREITLVLLRRMADLQPLLVERARHRLGASVGEMREANRRWNAARLGRPGPPHHARFAAAFGLAAVDHAPVPEHPGTFRSAWPVALWPDLCLQVIVDEADLVWHVALVRAAGSPAPALRSIEAVSPWQCTLGDCLAAFPAFEPQDVGMTGHEGCFCIAPDRDGTQRRWFVRSIWGLVQRVELAGEGPRSPSAG